MYQYLLAVTKLFNRNTVREWGSFWLMASLVFPLIKEGKASGGTFVEARAEVEASLEAKNG